jgi:hypothetical protein
VSTSHSEGPSAGTLHKKSECRSVPYVLGLFDVWDTMSGGGDLRRWGGRPTLASTPTAVFSSFLATVYGIARALGWQAYPPSPSIYSAPRPLRWRARALHSCPVHIHVRVGTAAAPGPAFVPAWWACERARARAHMYVPVCTCGAIIGMTSLRSFHLPLCVCKRSRRGDGGGSVRSRWEGGPAQGASQSGRLL